MREAPFVPKADDLARLRRSFPAVTASSAQDRQEGDRQLAYYASRAWARLYCGAVLEGVYDVDELEGKVITPQGVIDHGVDQRRVEQLHERLVSAKSASTEGCHDGAVDEAVNGDDKPKPKKRGKAKKPEPKKKPTKTPTNLGGYRAHVRQWVTRSGART